MYIKLFKPLFDFLTSSMLLFLLSPIILLLIILLFIANKGNVFFIQERPGKNEKIFSLMKFKTMNDKKDINGNLLPDIERLTKIGAFVRKTSLDELPQLINVLKGDMSLIGPRPLLVEYLPLYNAEQKKRHNVKPGITGWAQVNGRNSLSWENKFNFDIWYINNISFCLDIKIFLITILKIFKRDGITSETHATMEKFKGSNK